MPKEIELTPHQKKIYNQILFFVGQKTPGIFILNGYAGTGKTTLLRKLANQLKKDKKAFTLLATTGRAATIFRARTNFNVKTIHSELYTFSEVEGDNESLKPSSSMDEFGQMSLKFTLRLINSQDEKIFIIDESSMISDLEDKGGSYATFGSGRLLSDLITVAGKNQILFTGDPCQLPPVFGKKSPALSPDWFEKRNIQVEEAELTEVIRQDGKSKILELATRVRKMILHTPPEKFPKLPVSDLDGTQIKLCRPYNIMDSYLAYIDQYGIYNSMAIVQSNRACFQINRVIRNHLFGNPDMILMPGDILLVTQNNYLVPLTNGDLVEVVSLEEKRIKSGISFINGKVKSLNNGVEYEILICLETLNTKISNLTPDQQRMLMINFSRRMKDRGIKSNSQKYKEELRLDPYLNSLRVGYGYAITCHKAQGGEWDSVFLFLDNYMYSMGKENLLRWWYTAITRAKNELYLSYDTYWAI